jgi:hypothetical protein
MIVHRGQELRFLDSGGKIELRAECVQREVIVMQAMTGRRHRAQIAEVFSFGPRIAALAGLHGALQLRVARDLFRQRRSVGRKVVDQPVDPGLRGWSVGVFADERQFVRGLRNTLPRQQGGHVVPFARVSLGNLVTVFEGGGMQSHGHDVIPWALGAEMRASSSSDYYAAPGSPTHEANLKSAPGVMVRAENSNAEAGRSQRNREEQAFHHGTHGSDEMET